LGLAAFGVVFVLCCAADAFVLRTVWIGKQPALGQFGRGYFETFADGVSLAIDGAIRPDTIPTFLLTDGGDLGVPPGMTAVAPLTPGVDYILAADSPLAAYIVIGAEAPVTPVAAHESIHPGEARLVGGRTLSLRDSRLALEAWDPARPWREDADRLTALRRACALPDGGLALAVTAVNGRLDIRLGRCAASEPLPSQRPLLAALAGPAWLTITRHPGWMQERRIQWPVLAAIVLKVGTIWWGLGAPSAVAVSAALGLAAWRMPLPATLTWPLTLAVGLVAAALRAGVRILRKLPSQMRVPAVLAVGLLAAGKVALDAMQPDYFPPITRAHAAHGESDACAVIGYSTVKGEGLRREHGGIRWDLDESCERCRAKTAGLFAGGETLDWARKAYCSSARSFGANGQVIFWGGANDDFLTGLLAIAQLMVVAPQGIGPWHNNQVSASAASLARIDLQVSALDGLMQCVRTRGARFLFLHDFLVTDLLNGRGADRTAMLARRRTAVETAGGTFIDLLEVFGPQAGISWFNDYVHPSLIAHERIADLVCHQSP